MGRDSSISSINSAIISLELDERSSISAVLSSVLENTWAGQDRQKQQFKRKKTKGLGQDLTWSRTFDALPAVELTEESKILLKQDPDSLRLKRRKDYERSRQIYRRRRTDRSPRRGNALRAFFSVGLALVLVFIFAMSVLHALG